MSINRTKIDEAQEAIQEAHEALKAAVDNHVQAITTEAQRAVSERMRRDERRDTAAENLRSISEQKAALEADLERLYAAYQHASFRGDEDEAATVQASGDIARSQLDEIRTREDEARRNLEAATFDEAEADDALRQDLSSLRVLVPDDAREAAEAGITLAFAPIRRTMQERDEARSEREHRRRVEARQRYANEHRTPSGTIHVTNAQGR